MKHALLTLTLALTMSPAYSRECSRHEAIAAETTASHLDSWVDVYRFYGQFKHCFDGAIAEGAIDEMHLLWAHKWSELNTMLVLTKKDPAFRAFIWRNVGAEMVPQDTYALVVRNARSQCPEGGESFCNAVLAKQGDVK